MTNKEIFRRLGLFLRWLDGRRHELPTGHTIAIGGEEGKPDIVIVAHKHLSTGEVEEIGLIHDMPLKYWLEVVAKLPDDKVAIMAGELALDEINAQGGPAAAARRTT